MSAPRWPVRLGSCWTALACNDKIRVAHWRHSAGLTAYLDGIVSPSASLMIEMRAVGPVRQANPYVPPTLSER